MERFKTFIKEQEDLDEGWVKPNKNSQRKTKHDNAGKKVKTPGGEGTIDYESKEPTFSKMVPHSHHVWVKHSDGKVKSYHKREVTNLKEEQDEVNELSKKTLGSYSQKAKTAAANAYDDDSEEGDKEFLKRRKGAEKADAKIKKLGEDAANDSLRGALKPGFEFTNEESEVAILDEKARGGWGNTTMFSKRMEKIDAALKDHSKSKKDKVKSLRKGKKKVNELWTSNDTPYDEDGTIVEKKKKKSIKEETVDEQVLMEDGHVYHVHYAVSKYHKQNVARYDDEDDAKKFLDKVKKQGYNGMVVKRARNEKISEGSAYFGVDPAYMNAADALAKNKSFSPAALQAHDINVINGDDLDFDDNAAEVVEEKSELQARLEASDKFAESVGTKSVNELSKKTLGSYIKKASKDAVHKTWDADRKGRGKRLNGIEKATDKLTKEDHVEESKKLLRDKTMRLKNGDTIDDNPKMKENDK